MNEESMRINTSTTSFSGWMALGTGVIVILAVISLILMFTVIPSFGALNDVLNGMVGVLSAVLAWMLHTVHRTKSPLMVQWEVAVAILGAIFSVIGSVLILYDFTGYFLAGLYSALGNALIGVWLLSFCYSMHSSSVLPRPLTWFGFVVAGFMALGLIGIPGILAGIDSMESMPGYLYVASLGWLGTYLLYPIWLIVLGQRLLYSSRKEKHPR
jgi:hypothetical protein